MKGVLWTEKAVLRTTKGVVLRKKGVLGTINHCNKVISYRNVESELR